ncbi:MAG: two-component sensor histidine kinase [Alphaproteobacteria bacterium]|nr:MAG: two-component sensor histidine kinase [Alphaproteobacteria bacterium]
MVPKKKIRWIKRFVPRTLFGRSLLILILPILIIQAISMFIFFDRHWVKMTSRLAFAVAGEISILSSYIDLSDNDEMVQKIMSLSEQHLEFLITFDRGEILIQDTMPSNILEGWEGMVRSSLMHELGGAMNYPFTVDVDFQEKWTEVRVQLPKGVLNVSLPQRRLFSSTTYIFLIWVFFASTILLIISILFMRNQIRPIRRLALAAERFGKGRRVENFKIEGAKEVRQAGQAFLDMKTRLQRQITQRTDMLAGVSHDLRTPLTRLKLQVAMMGDSPDIYDIKNDINDMEKMIEGYLNFVRGDGRETTLLTDVSMMLRDVTISTKRQGCDVALTLNDVSDSIPLRPTAFKRCLNNILSNAAKYADFIWVTLERTGDDEIHIVIEDNGPGIDDNKFEEVFRPFYRLDSSRNVNTGGVGLGLPIAMDIVHTHGGKIWLEKSAHGGLAVHIILPV